MRKGTRLLSKMPTTSYMKHATWLYSTQPSNSRLCSDTMTATSRAVCSILEI
jgi:hypothetical protein